jgi:hypothetical protein
VPGSERIERYQQQILAALTPAEAEAWHHAVAPVDHCTILSEANGDPYHTDKIKVPRCYRADEVH